MGKAIDMALVTLIARDIGPVLPADSARKRPLEKDWQDRATQAPEGIDFTRGVAVKTGLHDGRNLIVVDVDNAEAEAYLTTYLTREELNTYTVKTRRGKHYYFLADPKDSYRNRIGLGVEGLDIRANGGLVISPPSDGYSIINDTPIAQLPVYLKGIIGLYSRKSYSLEPSATFVVNVLWEFLRAIDPSLNRNDWLKILSIAKFYYKDSYNITKYWSALSNKYPGDIEFKETWDSLTRNEATPASLIYLANEYQWSRSVLPIIPFKKLRMANELSEKLYKGCLILLERKNTLTSSEKEALMISAEVLVYSLYSDNKQRIAIPLPTGFGKSTLIRSLIKLIKMEGLNKKILICVASHAEILESIDELEDMEVTGETVGVFMSKDYNSPWDTDEPEEKSAVYISHNRVYGVKDYDGFSHLSQAGEEERLVIWDESAQTTKGAWVNADTIEEQAYGLIKRMDRKIKGRTVEEEALYLWAQELTTDLFNENYGQKWVPEIQPVKGITVGEELKKLIDNSGCYVAMSKSGDTDALLIRIEVRIPDEINCVIFDASAEVRELIKYDKSISYLKADVKRDYSQCSIDCVNIKSSKSFLNDPDNVDLKISILKEWMEKNGICGNELLVITQKPRFNNKDIAIDIPAKLKEEIDGVSVITWGSERGINSYKNLKYTANIGMKWRDKRDLKAEIQASRRDLESLVTYPEIDSVQETEFLSEVQQWIPRTNMRFSIDGEANGTKVLFMHSQASVLAGRLSREVFQGIKVSLYDTKVETIEQEREGRVEQVLSYLDALTEESISTRKLKADLGFSQDIVSKRQWESIVERVKTEMMFLWEKVGKSWHRLEVS